MPASRYYESLRNKLLWPFFWLGLLISATLSLVTYFVAADLTERSIHRTLRIEFEDYEDRLRRNPDALLVDRKSVV